MQYATKNNRTIYAGFSKIRIAEAGLKKMIFLPLDRKTELDYL
jgi:hypothetical protein